MSYEEDLPRINDQRTIYLFENAKQSTYKRHTKAIT